jgi:hypothetical protein
MRSLGLEGAVRGKKCRTTVSDKNLDRPVDRVKRQFKADRPDQLWVADISVPQQQVANHRKRRAAKARVVSVTESDGAGAFESWDDLSKGLGAFFSTPPEPLGPRSDDVYLAPTCASPGGAASDRRWRAPPASPSGTPAPPGSAAPPPPAGLRFLQIRREKRTGRYPFDREMELGILSFKLAARRLIIFVRFQLRRVVYRNFVFLF